MKTFKWGKWDNKKDTCKGTIIVWGKWEKWVNRKSYKGSRGRGEGDRGKTIKLEVTGSEITYASCLKFFSVFAMFHCSWLLSCLSFFFFFGYFLKGVVSSVHFSCIPRVRPSPLQVVRPSQASCLILHSLSHLFCKMGYAGTPFQDGDEDWMRWSEKHFRVAYHSAHEQLFFTYHSCCSFCCHCYDAEGQPIQQESGFSCKGLFSGEWVWKVWTTWQTEIEDFLGDEEGI